MPPSGSKESVRRCPTRSCSWSTTTHLMALDSSLTNWLKKILCSQ